MTGDARPSLDELLPGITAILGIHRPYVRMEYDEAYPECLSMVVIDVGPAKMEEVVAFLRKQPGKLRLYAKVIDRKYARAMRAMPFKRALEMAGDYSIATVRSE